MAVSFMLLAVLVQVAVLVGARASAQAAVDSFARRAAVVETLAERALVDELDRSLPGARDVIVDLVRGSDLVVATASFEIDPPGPLLAPVSVQVRGQAPVIAPP